MSGDFSPGDALILVHFLAPLCEPSSTRSVGTPSREHQPTPRVILFSLLPGARLIAKLEECYGVNTQVEVFNVPMVEALPYGNGLRACCILVVGA